MKTLFAPGCALNKYKPALISKISQFLLDASIIDGIYLTCCKSEQRIEEPVTLITCCPGCSGKFEMISPDVHALSLWKVLLDTDFHFPDYQGVRMSIHDSCHSVRAMAALSSPANTQGNASDDNLENDGIRQKNRKHFCVY